LRPQTYGTSAVSYLRVPAAAFLPAEVDTNDDRWQYITSGGLRWQIPLCCGQFEAPLQLPNGAKITYLELDFYDSDQYFTVYASLTICDYHGRNCSGHPAAGAGPADCLTPGSICSGYVFDGGDSYQNADLSPEDITVDNLNNSYFLYANNGGHLGSTAIAGMLVGYVLQVSPAPFTATFADVPVSHPFFQFVEALAAAGITGGCGGGNFCPNNPLTRGQMAVFLAKALGLQWP
jgi:hypothetical protein